VSEERKIRFEGEELGEFSIRQVMRMAEKGEINHTAEYWSEKWNEWRRLPSFISDFDDGPDRVVEMKAAGISRAKILGADDSDCPACKALQGRPYAVAETPVLPPGGCTCVPWCRCVVLAAK
jgi:hypothetical protein